MSENLQTNYSDKVEEYPRNQQLTVAKSTPINGQWNDLNTSLAKLDELLSDFTTKLAPVLAPESPTECGSEKPPKPLHSPLGMQLYDDTEHVKRMQARVYDLMSRLEV